VPQWRKACHFVTSFAAASRRNRAEVDGRSALDSWKSLVPMDGLERSVQAQSNAG